MQVKVRLSKSIVGPEEAAAASRVILENGFFGMSREVQAFERELAEFIGNGREVTCVSAATAALHLALQACGIGPGDEVLVPTITYVATFQAVTASGATPVACEVLRDTSWLDVEDAARRITPRTRAIIPVHYASGTGDIAAVRELARKHNLRVIEDAAHAFGCTYEGKPIGATGDVVCFSFQGTKNITSGEGGAVVTADPAVAERIRDLRLLDVLKDTENRYRQERSWEFDVVEQGWRYHMSDLFAAIGRVQLQRFEREFKPRRVALAKRYSSLLAGLDQVRVLPLEYGSIVPHIYPIYIEDGRRDAVREALACEGIETGIHYKPNHLLTLYGGGEACLPVAEQLYREMLTLPLHPALTEHQQDEVVAIVRRVVEGRAIPSHRGRRAVAVRA
ncbi:MAG: aminotransferase class I/II-fold pyridoxal phosphate-dependent enzyme [Dehalococcoidia bacterium]|nr:aminotransferase class I/II-fold pyridoxal phosphate-dependent enzyme [Dehalococcoidia bacterium]